MIDLLQCVKDHFKFGKMDDQNYNTDLIVFTDPVYFFEVDSKKFVCFEFINN